MTLFLWLMFDPIGLCVFTVGTYSLLLLAALAIEKEASHDE